jgi:TRAP-type C4-dicarboxylate transport system substrate-binding protein
MQIKQKFSSLSKKTQKAIKQGLKEAKDKKLYNLNFNN